MSRYKHAVLTDEQVIEMRESIRATREMRLRHWAAMYGVSHVTILHAVRGKTFSDLPHAITETFSKKLDGRKCQVSDDALHELFMLRQRDSMTWTFQHLSDECNRRHGTRYYAVNIKRLLERRFGTVNRPVSAAVPREKAPPCVRAPRVRSTVSRPKVTNVVPMAPVDIRFKQPAGRVVDISTTDARKSLAERLLAKRYA